jgi:glutamate/tyrosine decarboxylase-like PLP-dependent enzyme
MAEALDDDVILIAGSAPCYPFGVFDPLAELAALAEERGIWFHVDACVGGYLAPFVKRLGYPVPDFDLSLPGVWSLSADLHKYGFAPKNLSTVLYRDQALREYSTFSFKDWPAGAYVTAGMGGSRTGGPVAATWALVHVLGEEGYLAAARAIMATRDRLYAGLERIGLSVCGTPELGLVSYRSDALDMGAVADALDEHRWSIGRGIEPDRIINLINPINATSIDAHLEDLEAAVAAARSGKRRSGAAAVYTRD